MKYRISYTVIVFLIGAAIGYTLPTLFVIAALFELLMISLLLRYVIGRKEISFISFYGFITMQYANGCIINPVQIIHMGGARMLACVLGFFAIGYYIPTILIYLSTCIDLTKKGA